MPGGQINLEVLVAIQKAQQDLASLSQSVRQVDQSTAATAKSAGRLDEQLEKCGKSMLHIGRGGMLYAGIAIIQKLLSEYKKWEEHLDAAGRVIVKVTADQLRLNAAAGFGAGLGGGAKGAKISKELMAYGAAQGIMPEDARAALTKLWEKMKHKTPEERERAGVAMFDLLGAGVSPEQAAKDAQKGDVVARVLAAQGQAAAGMANEPGSYEARRNEIARAQVAYEAMYPATEAGRQEKVRGLDVEYEKSLEAGRQQRAGYLLKEGKPLSAIERAGYGWAAGDEDDWTKNRGNRMYHPDVKSFGADLQIPRQMDDVINKWRAGLESGSR